MHDLTKNDENIYKKSANEKPLKCAKCSIGAAQ